MDGLLVWRREGPFSTRVMVFIAAGVLTALSSFPPVGMGSGGGPVGQAPAIPAGQPIMLTDT